MATCASDQRIKVWQWESKTPSSPLTAAADVSHDGDDTVGGGGGGGGGGEYDGRTALAIDAGDGARSEGGGGQWECTYSWQAHTGSVWKVEWAHPEFGQVIASCSADRSVNIWEEPPSSSISPPPPPPPLPLSASSVAIGRGRASTSLVHSRPWIKLASIVDATDSVVDIKFAPRHIGLKLAVCSLDGHVRIYEAADVMNLSHWQPEQDFEVAASNDKGGSSERGTTAVDDAGDGANRSSLNRSISGATCISWNPSPFEDPMIVVGCQDGSVKVWQYSDKLRKWNMLVALEGQHSGAVHDISWAPSMGRSYHLISSAGKDGKVIFWQLRRDAGAKKSWGGKGNARAPTESSTAGSTMESMFDGRMQSTSGMSSVISTSSASGSNMISSTMGASGVSGATYQFRVLDVMVPHSDTEVWRVEWNVTGTVLATSGDDGTVKLYKRRLFDDVYNNPVENSINTTANLTRRKAADGSLFKLYKTVPSRDATT